MTAFVRVTAEIDALDIQLCPAAQFLKRFLLRKKPEGKLVDLDLEEFRQWTGQRRASGKPFCWKWIRQAFRQLIQFGLLKVEFHCGGRRWWKVRAYYLPFIENGKKTSPDENITSPHENKNSQKQGRDADNFVPSLVDIEETTDHPTPHPVNRADGKEDLHQNTCSSLEGINFTDLFEPEDDRQGSNSAARVDEKINTSEPSGANQKANVNTKADAQLEQLDELGVKLNPVLAKLVRTTKAELVQMAITAYQSYKRDHHVLNPAGFIVTAIKNGFQDQQSTQKANFSLWYQWMKELRYAIAHEVRDGEDWVNTGNLHLAHYWERFEDLWNRGYTMEYLQKARQKMGFS